MDDHGCRAEIVEAGKECCLLLRSPALGDVPAEREDAEALPGFQDGRVDLYRRDCAGSTYVIDLEVPDKPVSDALLHGLRILLLLVYRCPFKDVPARDLCKACMAGQADILGVGIKDIPLCINDDKTGAGCLDQCAVLRPRSPGSEHHFPCVQ